MTNPHRRMYVGVLDTSSSMAALIAETVAGWNGLVKEQASAGGAFASLFTFNSKVTTHYQLVESDEVPEAVLRASGLTALHDGLGIAIDSTGGLLAALPENERPSEVNIVVYTDGLENDSHLFTQEQVRNKVEHQRTKYGWNFFFHGAQQDAILVGRELGIPKETSLTYNTTNTAQTFATTSGLLSRGAVTGSYAYTDQERAEVNKP
jgi:uncharacterized protein YegL